MGTIKQPLHIVMTPVRNEAWVLRAFLETTSRWADYIIIADQMSTDGSRELYKEYQQCWSASTSEHKCELIVIDNKNPEFNEAERQAMLISKAREIEAGRDTLLWGLDADEIVAANAFETEDWEKILSSAPGAVFFFKWAIISQDLTQYQCSSMDYPWLFHDDGQEPHGNYVRQMHSMRIPYPLDEHDINYVTQFSVLHLAWVNPNRVAAKRRFYTYLDWSLNHRSVITLARTYTAIPDTTPYHQLTDNMVYSKENNGIDMWSLVCTNDKHCWMDDYVFDHLTKYSQSQLERLMIWDVNFMREYNLLDSRSFWIKIIHWYLQKTMSSRRKMLVRIIDKILKKFI